MSGGPAAASQRELMAQEETGWRDLIALVGSLSPEQADRAGYFTEGWSAKDVLGHVGTWLAEAGTALEQIRMGTYRPEELDVDARNEEFLETMRPVPFPEVRAQAWAARNRMLQEWQQLAELTPEAARWIRKSGPDHYAEHLPRLREWVAEVRS